VALIFQYGSNTSTARLNGSERLQGAAGSLGLAITRDDYHLGFTYWSQKINCAAADLIPGTGRKIYGVVYEIPEERIYRDKGGGLMTLDEIEGESTAYRRTTIEVFLVELPEKPVTATTYVVKNPQEGLRTDLRYVEHIFRGLREHDAPEEYVDYVKQRTMANNPELVAGVRDL
jgi:gamma-glutamylcyclotransferase